MKITKKLIVLIAVLVLALSSAAVAENRAGAITLTPMVGYHLFDGALNLNDGASYGLALGYNFTPEWGIEADLRYTPDVAGLPVDIDVRSFGLSGLYHFQPEQAFNPYLAVGLGGIQYDIDGTSSNDEDYMVYWGGGFKYAISDSVALRLDLRHILDARTDNRFNKDDDSTFRHHLSAMLGLTFQFGGSSTKPVPVKPVASPVIEEKPAPVVEEKPAPVVPVDSDGDGVFDPNDKCPNTPAGARVNTDGCPLDSDSDGVFDYMDDCLNTPKGAPVDSRGCAKKPEKVATLTLNLLYGVNKHQVTVAHTDELAKAAGFIAKYPGYDVVVSGHTDDQGADSYNMQLSQHRADNVRQALIKKYGIDPVRITAHGYGETSPVASNDTTAGRTENRRVEINILGK